MRTKRWLFIAALVFSAALVGWGSSLALFNDDPNDLVLVGSALFNSPVPVPKPTRFSRPTRLPTPRVIPTPHSGPFRDEQNDLIVQEDVGVTPHGQIMRARTKDKTTQGPRYYSPDIFAASLLTPTVFLPFVVKPEIYYPKVLVVAYINDSPDDFPDPDVPADPSVAVDTLTNQLIMDLAQGSIWHGYAISGTPVLNFSVSISGVIKLNELPPYRPDGNFDYVAFYNRFNICSLVQSGLVDEVWVWGNANSYMWENVVNGPTWSMVNGPVPNCGRTVATFGFNYFRHISQALEAYAHSIEYFMQRFVPAGYESCDFRTASKSFYSWATPSQCTGQWAVSDIYGFTSRAWPENSNVGVCGWSHQPPNQTRVPDYTDPDSMYHYLLTNVVQSRCTDWQWGGSNTSGFDCYTYGCVLPPPGEDDYVYDLRSEEKYLIWWMQSLPGLGNNNKNRNGNLRPNWWTIKWK